MTQLGVIFDDDPAVAAALSLSRGNFELWAANDAGDPLPDNPIDAIQIQLMRWQRAKFGDTSDALVALGIIEEMTETFDADDASKTNDALDGLGDVQVYAAQLATANRLAIAPIIDLARIFTSRNGMRPIRASGVLAQVVLKRAQKIRGLDDDERYYKRIVGALAMCIAKAIDDVELMHDINVKPHEILLVVANEVMQRGAGHDGIPRDVKPEETRVIASTPAERKERAARRLAEAIEKDPDTEDPAPADA